MTDDALIHLRVPASLKARWVRESRAAGLRLTDWIVQNVEASMIKKPTPMTIAIPEGLRFSDLKLARDPDGHVSFDWAPIERICRVNNLDVALFQDGPEDNLASLLTAWYRAHLAADGARDPVYEDLIGEVRFEDGAGQLTSHAPGRA
jgi:hypothetical protein